MIKTDYPEEGDLVLCTVEKVLGTTVFVNLDDYGKTGVVATSEVAAGRIRNIRDYVIVKKKIVCKVLRVDKARGHIDLSLRRVSQKETKEVLERYKNNKAALTIMNIVLKDRAKEISDKIEKEHPDIFVFFASAIENPALLDRFFEKEDAKNILNLIRERVKEKIFEAKAKLSIHTTSPEGISLIKKALNVDAEIKYLGAPNYTISIKGKDHKEINRKLDEILREIEKRVSAFGKIKIERE